MKQSQLTTYPNGYEVRIHNRRIKILKNDEGSFNINLQSITENPEIPTVHTEITHKGKVAFTFLKLSEEAIQSIVYGYLEYLKELEK